MIHTPKFHADDGSERIKAIRAEFEEWYVRECFNLVVNPIGGQQCDQQWRAWIASWNRRAAPVVSEAVSSKVVMHYERLLSLGQVDKGIAMKAAITAALETPDV